MRRIFVLTMLATVLLCSNAWSEDGLHTLISPGELAKDHAKYEGIRNCTKCHRLGGGLPDSRCLDCHDKLAARIKQKKGTHARFDGPCVRCHGDHKGRSFKMINIDEEKFDHDRTDYILRDKHAEAECKDCHKKQGTYSGARQDCLSCHKDEHKGQLSKKCDSCHNIKGWKEVERFDHDRDSKYALTFKHKEVKCAECHAKGRYKPIAYKKCDDCHKDAHKGQFRDKLCDSCHVTAGWKKDAFDHASPSYTGYKLDGRHTQVKCAECHAKGRYRPVAYKKCDDCHKDIHKGQFRDKLCDSCHVTAGWKKDAFDHADPSYTGYKLDGRHTQVKCAECHAKGRYKPIAYKKCDDCHKDPHKGQFRDEKCDSCHVTAGWGKDAFDHADPAYTGYKLDGRHTEVKCAECHAKGRYKPIAYKKCDDCHKDPHKGQFRDKKCDSCHVTAGWKKDAFDHADPSYTGYKLDGRHTQVKCAECHAKGRYKPIAYKKCDDCHKDIHKGQLKDKVCETCHTTSEWKKLIFDHNAPQYSTYRLEGKHEKTVCAKCHVDGKYKPIKDACITCHVKDDVHKNELGRVCEECHTAADWKKSTLNHNTGTKFPLAGAHKTTECSECHKTRNKYKTSARKCEDCHKDPHNKEFKEECGSCHTQYNWRPRNFDHAGKTGYPLKGVHNDVICQNCHLTKGTFRKVSRFCNQCHTDPHLNQFGGKRCSECHSESSWGPTRFNHSGTGYPLIGMHRTAECTECHARRIYRNTAAACVSCHSAQYAAAPGHAAGPYSRDCTQCHASTFTDWSFRHSSAGADCSSCHLALRPASHSSNPVKYPVTCAQCHSTASWTAVRHMSTSTNCSSCHMDMRPASHTADPATYPTACELCHTSTGTWTAHRHASSTNCSSCHLSSRPASHLSDPAQYPTTCQNCHAYPSWNFTHPTTASSVNCNSCHSGVTPAPHKAYAIRFGTLCQSCHVYPSWLPGSMNHSFSAFPTNHQGFSRCSDCHPGYNYGNKGGCIECHTARGEKVHKTSSNAGCLSCHPTGRE